MKYYLLIFALLLCGCKSGGGHVQDEPMQEPEQETVIDTEQVPDNESLEDETEQQLTVSNDQNTSQPAANEYPYIWIGDSRCHNNPYLENKNCKPGRQLVHLTEITPFQKSHDIIIIHLGHNDMKNGLIDPVVFGEHLSFLIQGIEDKVWCLIPTPINYYVDASIVNEYRQQMLDRCINTVDPQIEGYAEDQIHYTDVNYRQIMEVLDNILGMATS